MADAAVVTVVDTVITWSEDTGEFLRREVSPTGELLQVVTFPDRDRWCEDMVDRGLPDLREVTP